MNARKNLALLTTTDSVRLDDCESTFESQERILQIKVKVKFPPFRPASQLLQGRSEGGAEIRGRFYGADAGGGHRGVLVLGGALAAADDRAGVAHAASRRSGLAGDEADDGLLYVGLDPLRGSLFGVAADFADHNDGVRVRIVVEKLDGVEERRADDGIAADADAGGLADAEFGQLVYGFVGERAAAADDADISLLVDAARHDSDFAFAGRDDAGAVGADEASLLGIHGGGDAHHVQRRDAFGDANDERNFRIRSFENGIGGIRRRDEDHGSIRSRGFRGVGDSIENGPLEMLGAAFAGGDAADDIRSVLDHLLRVEGAFAAGEALDEQARFFVNENAHRAPPASATTFCAPSFMPSAMVKFRPLSRRICWPSSTLVPSMRTTTGTFN